VPARMDEIDIDAEVYVVCRQGGRSIVAVEYLNNLGFDAYAYLHAFPADAVVEVHVAGHAEDAADERTLLIDSHDAPVDDAVWDLYAHFLDLAGPRPTLIERDGDVPAFEALLLERDRAQRLLERAATRRRWAA